MWRGKCLERLNSALSSKIVVHLNEQFARTGQVDFSSDANFEESVEFLFSWASSGTRAKLWFDDLSGSPEELAEAGRGMEVVALPLSPLRADCERVVTNYTRSSHTPHYSRVRADFLAGEWVAVNVSLVPGRPVYFTGRQGSRAEEHLLSMNDIATFEDTNTCGAGRWAPLWRPPEQAFSERQATLARRSAAARKPDLSRLLEVPAGLTLAEQIAFFANIGVKVSESSLKREWGRLVREGVVAENDARKPQRGRPVRPRRG